MVLLISIFVLYYSYRLFKCCEDDMNITRLNMLSWIFYMHFIIMALICSILAYYNLDNNNVISTLNASKQYIRYYVWLTVIYVMIVFPCSVLFVKHLLKYCNLNRRYKRRHTESYIYDRGWGSIAGSYSLYTMTAITICVCFYIWGVTGYIGLFTMLRGDYAVEMRTYWANTREINPYIKTILGMMASKFLSYLYYIYWHITHKKHFKYLFVMMVIFAILIQSMDMTKSSIILYLLSLYCLIVALDKNATSWKKFVELTIITTAIIILMYISYHFPLRSIGNALYHRLFTVQLEAVYKTYEFFPKEFDFIGIRSLRPYISSLLGMEYIERHAVILLRYMSNTYNNAAQLPGGMVSLFFAEAWANWGLIGVIISPIYCGIFVGLLYYLLRYPRQPERLALYALWSVSIPISEGFNPFIYPVGIVSSLLLYGLYCFFKKIYMSIGIIRRSVTS